LVSSLNMVINIPAVLEHIQPTISLSQFIHRKAKKTFFVYGETTKSDQRHLLIMISYYDHQTGMVPKPVIVYDKQGVNDPHDDAAISIDNQGYIWVFCERKKHPKERVAFQKHKAISD